MIVELDSWYLPDTAATSYRTEHVKTSVIAEAIDLERGAAALLPQRRCYELDGEDYRGVFRLERQFPTTSCPPTPSSSASTPARGSTGDELRAAARELLRDHLRPAPGHATRSSASATGSRGRPARAPRGRRRRLPRLRLRDRPHGRLRLRDRAPPTSTGCSARQALPPPRRWPRSSRAPRSSPSSSRAAGAFDPRRRSPTTGGGLGPRVRGARRGRTLTPCRSRPPVAPSGRWPRRSAARPWLAAPARRRGPARDGARLAARARAGHRGGRAARRRRWARDRDLDAEDWWFRTTVRRGAGGRRRGGRAAPGRRSRPSPRSSSTASGSCESESMFDAARGRRRRPAPGHERARDPLPCRSPRCLEAPRKPRARWRTRLVADGRLRWFRTMMLGRAPGFAPGPAARSGRGGRSALERRRGLVVDALCAAAAARGRRRRPRASTGACARSAARRPRVDRGSSSSGPSGTRTRAAGGVRRTGRGGHVPRASCAFPAVARWWPHTHGEPALHDVRLRGRLGGGEVAIDARARRLPERSRRPDAGATTSSGTGSTCTSTGSRVFARGAIWTPVDRRLRRPPAADLRAALETGPRRRHEHAAPAGHRRLRDRRLPRPLRRARDPRLAGLHVRQPRLPVRRRRASAASSSARRAEVARPARRAARASPCSAATARSSSRWRCSASIRRSGAARSSASCCRRSPPRPATDAIYVPSAPCGGDLPVPHRPRRRELLRRRRLPAAARRRPPRRRALRLRVPGLRQRARRRGHRALLPSSPTRVVRHPAGRPGVPRDAGPAGTSTTSATTTSRLLFGARPGELRRVDHERYLELSRAVTRRGDGRGLRRVAARAGSPLRRRARPLAARPRGRAPAGAWSTTAAARRSPTTTCAGRSRRSPSGRPTRGSTASPSTSRTTGRSRSRPAARGALPGRRAARRRGGGGARLEPHGPLRAQRRGAARPLRRRVVGVPLRAAGAGPRSSPAWSATATRMPAAVPGVPLPGGTAGEPEPADQAGPRGVGPTGGDGVIRLRVGSRRLAYGVRIHAPGFAPDDDAFSVEPGGSRQVDLRPRTPDARFGGELSAINLAGRLPIPMVAGS